MLADRRLCLDVGKARLVEAGTIESAFLLAGKGQEIPVEEVRRLGLVRWSDGRVMQGPEPVAGLMPNLPPEVAGPQPLNVEPPPKANELQVMPPESRRQRRRRS